MENKTAKCVYCNKDFIKQYSSQKYCSIQCANIKNNVARSKNVRLPKEFNASLVEFMGILFGDGHVSKYFVKIYLNAVADRDYVPFVMELAKSLFHGASITVRFNKKDSTNEIQISSIVVANYLKKIGFNLPRQIPEWINHDIDFLKAFIRGLFDTEGSVGFKKFNGRNGKYLYKQLTFTSRNNNLLSFIPKNLANFRIKSTTTSRKNIYISNSEDIKKFLMEIGLHNPKLIKKILIKNKEEYIVRLGRGPQWKGARAVESAALEMR